MIDDNLIDSQHRSPVILFVLDHRHPVVETTRFVVVVVEMFVLVSAPRKARSSQGSIGVSNVTDKIRSLFIWVY